jgi:hypothetical protein
MLPSHSSHLLLDLVMTSQEVVLLMLFKDLRGLHMEQMTLSLLSSVEPHGSTCSSTISSANFLEGSLLGTKHSKEAGFTT